MNIGTEDFRRHFELLSDETLLATKREDLIEAARTVYDEEVSRRGLDEPPAGSGDGETLGDSALAQADGDPGEELVKVASFTILDEARLARGLLQSAGIPAGLANDKATLGVLHLMVPASFAEAAMQVMDGEISEEELAAQAEAAGAAHDEPDERDSAAGA